MFVALPGNVDTTLLRLAAQQSKEEQRLIRRSYVTVCRLYSVSACIE
jgi:hypothetical protein